MYLPAYRNYELSRKPAYGVSCEISSGFEGQFVPKSTETLACTLVNSVADPEGVQGVRSNPLHAAHFLKYPMKMKSFGHTFMVYLTKMR